MNFRALHIALLLITTTVFAQPEDTTRLAITVGAGFQQNDYRWSIAGTPQGKDPNILSELVYKNLRGPAIAATLRYHISNALAIQAAYTTSKTTAGTATDTDYAQDNRTAQNYHADFDSNQGHTHQWSAQLGYTFLRTTPCRLTAWLGYSVYNQQLYLLDNDGSTDPNLHSTYDTRWRGPLATLETRINLAPHFFTVLSATYHHTDYRSQANWNSIDTFNHPLSFEQTATGHRTSFSLAPTYTCTSHIAIHLTATYTTANTNTGTDRLFLKTGDIPETQFNGAKATALQALAGLTIMF